MPTPVEPLQITVDVAEPRLTRPAQAILVPRDRKDDGLPPGGWEIEASTDIFREFITGTVMLRPLPTLPQWVEGPATGEFARLTLDSFGLGASASWVEHDYKFIGEHYLYGVGPDQHAEIVTIAEYPADQPWWLSWWSGGPTNDQYAVFRAKLGDLTLIVFTDLTAQLLDADLNKIAEGSLAAIESQIGADPGAAATSKQTQRAIDLLVIPCRKRDILFLCDQGGGFVATLPRPASEPGPITAAGPLRLQMPQGQAQMSAAPLKFAHTGTLLSNVFAFEQAPEAGVDATLRIWAHDATYGAVTTPIPSLVESDGTTPFVADGTRVEGRIRVEMVGDGSNSPFVFAALAEFPPATALTDDSEATELIAQTMEAELSVGEEPGGVEAEITLREPALLDTFMSGAATMANRPIRMAVAGVSILDGRSTDPSWHQRRVDELSRLELKAIRDRWRAAETTQMRQPVPFDGRSLVEVVTDLATTQCGFADALLDVEDFEFILGENTAYHAPSRGEWFLKPEAGDTLAEWIERLWRDYARRYICGWVPTEFGPMWRFRDPLTMSTEPTVFLWRSFDEAVQSLLDDGYTDEESVDVAYTRVVSKDGFREQNFEPECNELSVWAWDWRRNVFYGATILDEASADPTLAPSVRPDNWLGERRSIGVYRTDLSSQEQCNILCADVFSRVGNPYSAQEIDSEFLFRRGGTPETPVGVPVWKGDVIEVRGGGYPAIKYRVTSLHTQFRHESEQLVRRPTTYMTEFIEATEADAPAPPPPPAGAQRVALSGASQHSLAIRSDGSIDAAGYNGSGQLADGTTTDSSAPVNSSLPGGRLAAQVAANDARSFALATDGTVWAAGSNYRGGLGDGTTTERHVWTQVVGVGGAGFLSGVEKLAAARDTACAVLDTGRAVTWGDGHDGMLANASDVSDPGTPFSTWPVYVRDFGVMSAPDTMDEPGGYMEGITDAFLGFNNGAVILAAGAVAIWGLGGPHTGVAGRTANLFPYSALPFPAAVADRAGGLLAGIAEVAFAFSDDSFPVTLFRASAGRVHAAGTWDNGTVGGHPLLCLGASPPAFDAADLGGGWGSEADNLAYAMPVATLELDATRISADLGAVVIRSDSSVWGWGVDLQGFSGAFGWLGRGTGSGGTFNSPQAMVAPGGGGAMTGAVDLATRLLATGVTHASGAVYYCGARDINWGLGAGTWNQDVPVASGFAVAPV